jgi:hypothetical protein
LFPVVISGPYPGPVRAFTPPINSLCLSDESVPDFDLSAVASIVIAGVDYVYEALKTAKTPE